VSPLPAEGRAAAAADEREVALASAALAGAALSAAARSVRTFDPSTGRFAAGRAEAPQDATNVDRLRFVETGIDW
jgi:hypothetical protein